MSPVKHFPHVLHLRSGRGIYGAETLILGLAGATAGLHPVTVASLRDLRWGADEPELLVKARERGLAVAEATTSGRIDPLAAWRIRKLCQRLGATVLHSHDYKSTLLGALGTVRSGIRHVATLHGDTGASRAVAIYERALYAALPAVDAVAVVSQNLLARVRERAPRARVHFIANGLDDAAVLARLTRSREAVRAELAVPAGARLVLAVGRLSIEKNHAALIDAVAGLPDLVVAIAGEGPLAADLERRARERGVTLRLLGARTDVVDLYRAADLLAHPSTTEGLPMVILEALAVGTPIVASAVGEIPRALDAAGEDGPPCGVVVPPSDVPALTRELTRVLGWSPAERAATAARALARVRGQYGAGAMAARYEAVLYQ